MTEQQNVLIDASLQMAGCGDVRIPGIGSPSGIFNGPQNRHVLRICASGTDFLALSGVWKGLACLIEFLVTHSPHMSANTFAQLLKL